MTSTSASPRKSPKSIKPPKPARSVELEVDVDLVSDSQFYAGLSGDIAEGGLFYASYRPIPLGTIVTVELSLPGLAEPLTVSGRVRWVREHSVEQPRGVGIAFDALSKNAHDQIQTFLSKRAALYYDDLDG